MTDMIEIEIEVRSVGNGRFEVEAPGRHHEAFEGQFGAVCTAQALAGEISSEGNAARIIYTGGITAPVRGT